MNVLVVEDDFLLASDLARTLRNEGFTVLGPVAAADDACRIITSHEVDCALVDINLQGDLTFKPAEVLRAVQVPFLFLTGYDQSALPSKWWETPRLQKPVEPRALKQALAALRSH